MRTSISVSNETKRLLADIRINDKQSMESAILMLIKEHKKGEVSL